MACNHWLKRIKIKESDTCSFCNLPDDIPHFFINYEHTTKAFWKTWGLWWEKLTNFNIRECEDIIECILFGFPGNKNNIIIIIFCIMYAKYYIYQKNIKNHNNIEFLTYLSLLKRQLLIEREICIAQNQEYKFTKFNSTREFIMLIKTLPYMLILEVQSMFLTKPKILFY